MSRTVMLNIASNAAVSELGMRAIKPQTARKCGPLIGDREDRDQDRALKGLLEEREQERVIMEEHAAFAS